jgi:hypothetical protein
MNSPSGGTNEMVRSLSNLPSFTHWWNVISASSMPVPLHARALDTYDVIANRKKTYFFAPAAGALSSIPSLSFMPKRHSGIPDSKHFI